MRLHELPVGTGFKKQPHTHLELVHVLHFYLQELELERNITKHFSSHKKSTSLY